jgi:hypothetical protein
MTKRISKLSAGTCRPHNESNPTIYREEIAADDLDEFFDEGGAADATAEFVRRSEHGASPEPLNRDAQRPPEAGPPTTRARVVRSTRALCRWAMLFRFYVAQHASLSQELVEAA